MPLPAFRLAATAALLTITSLTAHAQTHSAAVVVHVESAETNPSKPVYGSRVSLSYLVNGQSIRDAQNPTDAHGDATLAVSLSVTQTGSVRLEVINDKDLVILTPADGQLNALPPTVQLTLVKRGSKLLLGPAQVQAMLNRLSYQITALQRQQATAAQQQQQKPDLEQAINAWAATEGLTAAEVDTHVKDWADDIQKQKTQSTEEQLGLAAMALHHYDEAAQHFGAKKTSALNVLAELQKQQVEQTQAALTQVVQATQQTASAQQLGYHFHEATAGFEDTVTAIAPTCTQYAANGEIQTVCLNAKLALADARVKEASYGESAAGLTLVRSAIDGYRSALQVDLAKSDPHIQADVNVRLGSALEGEGFRYGAAGSVPLLEEAVAAYRHALEGYTERSFPKELLLTEVALGAALWTESQRTNGEQSWELLSQARKAYTEAVEIGRKEFIPPDWSTQMDLANALSMVGGEQAITQAVQIYRQALNVRTKDLFPLDWAGTQSHLANALLAESTFHSGQQALTLVTQAVDAYLNALQVYTRQVLPQPWARTQMNLGGVLVMEDGLILGTDGGKLFSQAIEAYRNALEVFTKEDTPEDWAMTQRALGNAYLNKGQGYNGEQKVDLLSKAIEAYQHELEIYTKKSRPRDWEGVMRGLASAHTLLGDYATATAESLAANEVDRP